MILDLGYFAAIVGVIAAILVLTYLAIRAIDHKFRNLETDREYAHEASLLYDEYTWQRINKRKEQETGYRYNRKLMNGFCDNARQLSTDVIKQVNESVWQEAKNMIKEFGELK